MVFSSTRNPEGPYNLRTYGQGATFLYGHMLEGSIYAKSILGLASTAKSAGLFYMPLMPATVIGITSYTGHCIPEGKDGTHLHYEIRPSYQYRQ